MLEVFFDGLCIPNNRNGIACYGFLIKKDGKVIYSDKGVASKPFSDEATNNVAEYTALIKALQWLKENGYAKVVVVPEGEEEIVHSPSLFRTAEGEVNNNNNNSFSNNNNIHTPG